MFMELLFRLLGGHGVGAGGNFTDERQSGLKENILTECGQFAIIPRLLWIIYALFSKSCI